MKRRTFGLLAGSSAAVLMGNLDPSWASTPDPELLKTTLTPMGSQRAGNAAGTIPAWTGGMTEIPPGFDWDPKKSLPPDFFAAEPMLYKVDSSNLSQYADLLSEGIQTLIKAQGYYVKVYPTHRTQALPQWVYDNIALNVTRATPQDGDYRMGFNGAYGGAPCPILSSDPYQAGAQVIWNHEARWNGPYFADAAASYTVENGKPILVSGQRLWYRYGYYQQGGAPDKHFGRQFYAVLLKQFAPGTVAGDEALGINSTNPVTHPQMSWALLTGQGRVRKTPNLMFDTPSAYTDDIINYDESYGFNGPLYEYDWKLLGKKEMLVPYNCNKIFTGNGAALHLPKYFDPEYTRWELHRVWVVEATLHPGQRNVLARRMLYVDEDDWTIKVADAWTADGNIVRTQTICMAVYPTLPGHIYVDSIAYNLQTGNYVSNGGSYADPPYNQPWSFEPVPDSMFLPQTMAATAAY